jgi:hypothetical protein
LARSHVGAITLSGGLVHFYAILMMPRAVFSGGLPRRTFEKTPRFDRFPRLELLDHLVKKHYTPSNQKAIAQLERGHGIGSLTAAANSLRLGGRRLLSPRTRPLGDSVAWNHFSILFSTSGARSASSRAQRANDETRPHYV